MTSLNCERMEGSIHPVLVDHLLNAEAQQVILNPCEGVEIFDKQDQFTPCNT